MPVRIRLLCGLAAAALLLSGCANSTTATHAEVATELSAAEWTAPPEVGAVNGSARGIASDEDQTTYQVVANDEEQYSIWPRGREAPVGWQAVGFEGSKEKCLAYIQEVWTDMRPLSLRTRLQSP